MKTLHELLKQISHGVYVISVCDGEENNAFTAAWVMQVSFSPLLLAFSISPMHRTYKLLCRSGECAINVLKQDQTALALHFSSSDLNLQKQNHRYSQKVQPILIARLNKR
jgi:flavin reductase (DIM6/NTAB) family NADH-FMN oxidoreductase RutF